MKKASPILLLMVFFLFQGGRILLYLECRFSNSITTTSCDCARILADAKPAADTIPVSSHANHRHLPEEFESHALNALQTPASAAITLQPVNSIPLAAGYHADIFHPPAITA